MPTDQIRDLLPVTMGGNVWRALARLKEQCCSSVLTPPSCKPDYLPIGANSLVREGQKERVGVRQKHTPTLYNQTNRGIGPLAGSIHTERIH